MINRNTIGRRNRLCELHRASFEEQRNFIVQTFPMQLVSGELLVRPKRWNFISSIPVDRRQGALRKV